MQTTLVDRIRARLKATGKSAATASLEAGLGRSAVQNILRGASESPRLSTLEALTHSLDCSLNYLTGADENPGRPEEIVPELLAWVSEKATAIEVGVYRSSHPVVDLVEPYPINCVGGQLIHWRGELLVMKDESMAGAGVKSGDVLSMLTPSYKRHIALEDELVVGVIHKLGSVNASEYSVRVVETDISSIRLCTSPSVGDVSTIELPLTTSKTDGDDRENIYALADGGSVEIMGVVTMLQRPIGARMIDT